MTTRRDPDTMPLGRRADRRLATLSPDDDPIVVVHTLDLHPNRPTAERELTGRARQVVETTPPPEHRWITEWSG